MQNWRNLIALTAATGNEAAAKRLDLLARKLDARLLHRLMNTEAGQNNVATTKPIKRTKQSLLANPSSRSVQSSSRSHLAAANPAQATTNSASGAAAQLHKIDVAGALQNDNLKHPFRTSQQSSSSQEQVASYEELYTLSDNASNEPQLEAHKFVHRHIGPREEDLSAMLAELGYRTMDELIEATIPKQILLDRELQLPEPLSEAELLAELKVLASENKGASEWRSFIGLGYYDCHTPQVILRNMFENPGWTTAYTAYQAEIAQGRLEGLMNYQTMVRDLTGLDVANASLLDEATAAAEAMQVCLRHDKSKRNRLLVSKRCHPQTIAVVESRAQALGVGIDYFDELACSELEQSFNLSEYSGLLVQYPNTNGHLFDLDQITGPCQAAQCLVVVATDLLACTLFKPPGDFEHPADLAVGSSQRLGIPLNYGGPHAAFLACRQKLVRSIPGRVVGLTRDSQGDPAYRFALQTREQHIRRDKATSNICTAQALLANMSAMFAVLHGPEGLREISSSIHAKTSLLAELIKRQQQASSSSHQPSLTTELLNDGSFFDTLTLRVNKPSVLKQRACESKINLRYPDDDKQTVCISLDETTKLRDVFRLANLFSSKSARGSTTDGDTSPSGDSSLQASASKIASHQPINGLLSHLKRTSSFLTHPTFNRYRSEAQLVRYMKSLENKDISLAHSMIPLGSCTMKLNATSQMVASSWPEFTDCHPFQPTDQCGGYMKLIQQLEAYLCEITGYDRISFQPNSGAQGEYAGLRTIKSYLESRGEHERKICLIPISAHGTNPASAQMAGFTIKTIKVRENGNIDLEDLAQNIDKYKSELACLMITYPSTFGVFEDGIREMCAMVHEAGGQVYLDGANMNAQVGLCRPGDYGSDVSHLNLHKTFCIPHGGGGPGAGPIGVKSHLVPFLPTHPLVEEPATARNGQPATKSFGTVSASMWGSPAILPISWSYIRLMSRELKRSSQVAILSANYMRRRLENDYKILFKGGKGNVAHEFIIDCRPFKKTANVEASDIAKRLQDFGLHAPTVSWPVANTLMLEPTESEDKEQLDRYCEALLIIRQEIAQIESGHWDKLDNPIKNAPHTQKLVCSSEWSKGYTREQAAYPARFVTPQNKSWPTVGRVDDIYGDINLFCSCAPPETYE